MINFNIPKIDSFTLLIPLENVEIVNPIFTSKYTKEYSTEYGEIIPNQDSKEFYENYCKTENNETNTFLKYKKADFVTGFNFSSNSSIKKQPKKEAFIQLMITSKIALSNYFEGINSSTIKDIYQYIIDDNVIRLTFEDLLNSKVIDIDVCKDYKADLEEFKDLKQFLLDYVLESKKALLKSQKINSKETYGITYNKRNEATGTKPFAKLYYKTFELKSSEEKLKFQNTNLYHLEEEINKGIARIEVTIKSASHKKRLGIEHVKTLKDLLEIPENELNRIYKEIIAEYYDPVKRIMPKIKTKMNPTETIIANTFNYILKHNECITSYELIKIAITDVEDKQTRYKIKLICEKIIDKIGAKKTIKANDLKKETAVKIMQDLNIFLE